jgi:hypothetical protein
LRSLRLISPSGIERNRRERREEILSRFFERREKLVRIRDE